MAFVKVLDSTLQVPGGRTSRRSLLAFATSSQGRTQLGCRRSSQCVSGHTLAPAVCIWNGIHTAVLSEDQLGSTPIGSASSHHAVTCADLNNYIRDTP